MLQHDIPFPPPKTTGRAIGIALHLIHAYTKWSEISNLQKEDDGWGQINVQALFIDEDEDEGAFWTRWVRQRHEAIFYNLIVVASLF